MDSNIYDLDDFSDVKENLDDSEKKEDISSEIDSNIKNSPGIDLSLYKSFSAQKPQMSGISNISKNNKYKNNINNSIDLIYDKEEGNLIKNKDNISNFDNSIINTDTEKKPGETFAIEDDIGISEFDKIKNPAMEFKFTLDTFQKRSIIRLEQKKNILVCAHTSSGKTLVAEYGIALGKQNNKKVIYTSPIKALSNQKYCDFKKKFKDVGIITGDVNINQNAQCLIITTEILHKFLYNQSSILNSVGTVIFDEIHYINDQERGHIWEEILIVLPSNISIIMLSATIPNYFEFANWVGKIKNTMVYIEITKTRVVPLQYFLYVNNENIFLVKDNDEKIKEDEIKKAYDMVKKKNCEKDKINENNLNLNSKIDNNKNENSNEIITEKNNETEKIIKEVNENNIKEEDEVNSNDEKEGENENNEINDEENNNENIEEDECNNKESKEKKQKKLKVLFETVNYIINKKLYPATLFIFNIRKIKEYSSQLIEKGGVKELQQSEKMRINKFFNKVISSIPPQEQNIKQIKYIKNLLQYGIGVHHSGLLPILKEIIEILYFKGLIKILIATTSFSIGLNMPTRTVCFISLYKYNENKRQILSSSEFLQMCGRAGRRGIDSSGNVYIICCEPLGKNQIKKIKDLLKGEGNELESKFRLSYRIILSFYHRNLKNINDFFQESFHENHNIEIKPEKLKEIEQIKDGVEKINKINCIIKDKVGWDIEESPIYKFVGMINEMDHINRKIFNNEKIIEYINSHPCSILQIKNNNNLTANKFHKPDIVMVVNIVKIKEMDKLWCITLTSYDESKINSKKEEEIKNNEQTIQPIFSDKGQIQEFKYKYMLINFNDIIEIYDTPKADKLETFYQKEKIKNYFNINEKGQYYFKDSPKILHLALKQLYRAILNHFPKKLSNIHGNKGPKKSDILENGKAKVIDYKKIIGEESIKKSISKLKDYKAKIKNNPCQTCPRYEKHLNLYKVIKKEKSKIEKIEKQIKNGEKNEIQKKFNNRISLLRELEYLQEDQDDNTGNDKYDNYTLTLKGKASLEIITNDNILITELLSSDIFYNNDKIISTQIIVSFLTIFVGNAKIKDIKSTISLEEEKYNEEAQLIKSKFFKIYNELILKEENLELKESVYNRSFSFKFFDSVFYWISGNNFCDACEKYNIVEGKLYHIIIRTFYFSEEIYNFYTKLGNEKLASIFKDIKDKLLKGIMSVESLYIQENIDINDI